MFKKIFAKPKRCIKWRLQSPRTSALNTHTVHILDLGMIWHQLRWGLSETPVWTICWSHSIERQQENNPIHIHQTTHNTISMSLSLSHSPDNSGVQNTNRLVSRGETVHPLGCLVNKRLRASSEHAGARAGSIIFRLCWIWMWLLDSLFLSG